MSWYLRFVLLVITLALMLLIILGQNQCPADTIGTFPFPVVQGELDSSNPCARFYNTTDDVDMVEFPGVRGLEGVKLAVLSIDYASRIMRSCDVGGCLPQLYIRLLHSSVFPFPIESVMSASSKENSTVAFFDCSSIGSKYLRNDDFQEQVDLHVCPIYVVGSTQGILRKDVAFCTNMMLLDSPLDEHDLRSNTIRFRWSQPRCDAKNIKTILYKNALPASGSLGLVLCMEILILIYGYFKTKKDDHARLVKFLKDYEALKPTRFSYSDIKRITNHFKDKIGEGAHGSVFKGKLSNQIIVAVKVLNNSDDDGKDFINEVGTMGKIHHINVVRLLGFCAEGFHRALVYDFFPNGSLENFISSPDNKENFLGWLKLQQIALGIAKGIEYLHHGCDYRILHFDINPGNVLLEPNLNPKISDFGLEKLCSRTQSIVSITAARGTLGYIASEVFSKNFGNVSYKSDIYSYGMLLMEMVRGRKNTHRSEEAFQILYPKWIHNLIEEGDINIQIEDEDDNRIARKLAIVGLWCIQWHPINRPSIKTVIHMIEGHY